MVLNWLISNLTVHQHTQSLCFCFCINYFCTKWCFHIQTMHPMALPLCNTSKQRKIVNVIMRCKAANVLKIDAFAPRATCCLVYVKLVKRTNCHQQKWAPKISTINIANTCSKTTLPNCMQLVQWIHKIAKANSIMYPDYKERL